MVRTLQGRTVPQWVTRSAGALGLATMACSGGSPTATPPTPPPPPPPVTGAYLADLKANLTAYRSDLASEVATGDSGTYVNASYYLHALIGGAESSGDTALMDELLSWITQMIAKAKPLVRNGVTYQQWGPWDGNGHPQQNDTFVSLVPLARAAAVIARNDAFRTRYATQFNQIVAFVDQAVFKYWFDKTTGIYADPASPYPAGTIPWLPKNLGGWGQYAYWPQQASHFATLAAWMYQATGGSLYLDAATRCAQGFRTHLVASNGHYMWDAGTYGWEYPDNQENCPDTSHANRVPMMMLALYENGIVFTKDDMDLLARTFLDVLWNKSASAPMFTNYIDGSNKAYRTVTAAGGNGLIFHGWCYLGRTSADVQAVVAASYKAIVTHTYRDPPLNASLDANASRWARMEFSGTLARNATP